MTLQEKIKLIIYNYRTSGFKFANKKMPNSTNVIYSGASIKNIINLPPDSSFRTKIKTGNFNSYSSKLRLLNSSRYESVILNNSIAEGQVQIGSFNGESQLSDMRFIGGGVQKSLVRNSFGKYPFVHSLADYGNADGFATQIGPTAIIEIPQSILSTFSVDKINEVTKKYTALGIYPVFIAYPPDIN